MTQISTKKGEQELEQYPSPVPRRIHLLNPRTAEQIAAGEVIERPASVVKEAVENALDAGATEIQVILEAGGKNRIEIIDNGVGMPPEDLELCIQRHATSKISSIEDLFTLNSFGFRGEALPSIAAVGALSIISRAQGELEAYELIPESPLKKVVFGDFLGKPYGTRLRLDSLFSTVPARLKFLKSPASEVSAVREWLERLSLTHSNVGFRLVHDGRTVLQLRPESESDRVRKILGDGDDYPILVHDSSQTNRGESFPRVRLYYLQGLSLPQTRRLYQVVNGRVLKDRLIQQAMLSPFKQSFLPGQFPALALFLDLAPADLDVNVHPSKTEVRFLEGSRIFSAIHAAGEDLVQTRGNPGYVAGSLNPSSLNPAASGQSNPVRFSTDESSLLHSFPPGDTGPVLPVRLQRNETFQFTGAAYSDQTGPHLQEGRSSDSALTGSATDAPTEILRRPHPFPEMQFARYVGPIFQTYLLYDLGAEAVLIDQHAAHERIRFEKLRRQIESKQTLHSQRLLTPEAIGFDPDQRLQIQALLPKLSEMGFEYEFFSEDKLLVRSVPAVWGTDQLKVRLKSLLEKALSKVSLGSLSAGENSILMDEVLFEELASEACHSSVRAHDRLTPEQAILITRNLFECEHPWNCPHGRPTVVRVPEGRFQEWFQRIVK